jgi:hypothetical protein
MKDQKEPEIKEPLTKKSKNNSVFRKQPVN